jgi:hypothetical protein
MREKLASTFNSPDSGVASNEDVDATINNTIRDVLEAEKLYKAHYASLFNKTGISTVALQSALQSSMNASHGQFAQQKAIEKLDKKIGETLASPAVSEEAKQENYQATLEGKSLSVAEQVLERMLTDKERPLPSFLRPAIEAKLKEVKEQKATLETTFEGKKAKLENSDKLVQMQAERILRDSYKSAYAQEVGRIQSKSSLEELDKTMKEDEEKKAKEDTEKFQSSIESEIVAGTLTSDALAAKKKGRTDAEKAWIDTKVKELKAKEKVAKETALAEEERKKREGVTEVEESLPIDDGALATALGDFKDEYNTEVSDIDAITDVDSKKKALKKLRKLLIAGGFAEDSLPVKDIDNRMKAADTVTPVTPVTPTETTEPVVEEAPAVEEYDLKSELGTRYDPFLFESTAALAFATSESRLKALKGLRKAVIKKWGMTEASFTVKYIDSLIEKETAVTPEVAVVPEVVAPVATTSPLADTSDDSFKPGDELVWEMADTAQPSPPGLIVHSERFSKYESPRIILTFTVLYNSDEVDFAIKSGKPSFEVSVSNLIANTGEYEGLVYEESNDELSRTFRDEANPEAEARAWVQKIIEEDVEAVTLEKEEALDLAARNEGLFPELTTFGKLKEEAQLSSYEEVNGIGIAEYRNTTTGDVDIFIAAFGDNDYLAYIRIYENGVATNRFTSKLERKSNSPGATKTMILELQKRLPAEHEYTEDTSVSTDGLKWFIKQLQQGYTVLLDAQGKPVTEDVAINNGSFENMFDKDGDTFSYNNVEAISRKEFLRLKEILKPLTTQLGIPDTAVTQTDGTVYIKLPVLVKKPAAEEGVGQNEAALVEPLPQAIEEVTTAPIMEPAITDVTPTITAVEKEQAMTAPKITTLKVARSGNEALDTNHSETNGSNILIESVLETATKEKATKEQVYDHFQALGYTFRAEDKPAIDKFIERRLAGETTRTFKEFINDPRKVIAEVHKAFPNQSTGLTGAVNAPVQVKEEVVETTPEVIEEAAIEPVVDSVEQVTEKAEEVVKPKGLENLQALEAVKSALEKLIGKTALSSVEIKDGAVDTFLTIDGELAGFVVIKIVDGKPTIKVTEVFKEFQKQGVAENIYIKINEALVQAGLGELHSDDTFLKDSKTEQLTLDGKVLSAEEKKKLTDNIDLLIELDDAGRIGKTQAVQPGIKLWEKLVRKGLAEEIGDGTYKFKTEPSIEEAPVAIDEAVSADTRAANLYIPALMSSSLYTETEPGIYTLDNQESIDLIETLTEIAKTQDVVIDLEVSDSTEFDTDPNDWSSAIIPISYDGKVIGYIPTIAGVNKGLKAFAGNEAVTTMLKHQLAGVTKLRKKLFENPKAKYATTLTKFSSGTMVKSDTLRNPLDVLVGEFRLFYANPVEGRGVHFSLMTHDSPLLFYRNSDQQSYYNHDKGYDAGAMYMLVDGFNAIEGFESKEALQTKIPIRLQVSTLDKGAVNTLTNLVNEVLSLLANDKLDFARNEQLNGLREKISEITAYQATNQEANGNIPKPTFKIHKDRIEFLFDGDTKLMRIYHNNGSPSIRVFAFKGTKSVYLNRQEFKDAIGEPITDTISSKNKAQFTAALQKALGYKQWNIKIKDLESGKITPQQLMEEGKLLTDMGVVLDSEGNKVSNFTAKPIKNFKESGGKNGNLVMSIDTDVSVKEVVQEKAVEAKAEESSTKPKVVALTPEELEAKQKRHLQRLEEAKEIAAAGETYQEALDALMGRQIALNKKLNEQLKLDKPTAPISQYTQEELEAQPGYQELKRIGRLIKLITDVYVHSVEQYANKTSEAVATEQAAFDNIKSFKRGKKETVEEVVETPEVAAPKPVIKLKEVEEVIEEIKPIETTPAPETPLHTKDITEEDLTDLFGKEEWENDVDDFDAYTMVADETTSFESIDPAERQKNWKSMFGDNVELDTNIEGLIYYKGKWAFGLFHNAMASVSRLAPRGTEFHEAFHVVSMLYLKEKAREAIYAEARKRWPKFAEATNRQVEEKIAEDFKAYRALKEANMKTGTAGIMQRFFDRLLYYINNILNKALGRTSIDNLYRGINSGAFNYAPTADMIEYAKKIGYTSEVPDLDTVFTPQELDDYTNYLSLIVFEHMGRYPHITTKDIKENPVKYNPRQVALAHLKRHGRNLVTNGEVEAAKHVAKIITYLGNEEAGLWARVKDNVEHKLNMKINYDESIEEQFTGSAALEKKWDDRAAFAVSSKESFDADLKRIIMTTYKLTDTSFEVNENGDKLYKNRDSSNPAMLPTGLDFNKVYPFLQTQMANAITVDEMLARLEAMSDAEPSLISLYEKVKKDPLLRAKWFVNFNKANMKARNHRLTVRGSGFQIKSDVSNKSYGLADTWTDNIRILIDETNRQKGNEHFTREQLTETQEKLAEVTELFKGEMDVAKASELLSSIAADLGFNLPALVINKMVNNPSINRGDAELAMRNIIFTPLNRVTLSLVDDLNKGNPLAFNEFGRVNELAAYASYYMFDTVESSYYNTAGNLVFSFAKQSFLSDFFDKVERLFNPYNIDKENAQADLLRVLTEYSQDPSMSFSNWLWGEKGFLTGTREAPELNINNLTDFKFFKSDGLKNTTTRFGAGYANLADQDWDIQNLLDYITTTDTKGTTMGVPTLIQSDSGNIWVVQSARFKFETDKDKGGLSRNSALFNALKNTVRQEVTRMKQAQALLFDENGQLKELSEEVKVALETNYHYNKLDKEGNPIILDSKGRPVGRVFQFHNMSFVDENGETKDLNKILESSGFMPNGMLDLNLFNANATAIIDAFVMEFANSQIKEGVDKYSKYKAILEESTAGKGKLLGRYNSFTEFVGELMLNTYISYVEHANFFNGTISELKNAKDTNKRAKQQSSPRQTASTWFRGETYKGYTIKDVELQSTAFASIVEKVTEKFKEENPKLAGLTVDTAKLEAEDTANYNELEKLVDYVVSGYKYTNIADGQSYMTLARYKATLQDYGRWNDGYAAVFEKLESDQELNVEELKFVLQVMKPYYYGREYDGVINKMRSRQIKNSVLPLIPQLVRGTDMEKILQNMVENNIGELYFQSATKVGSGYVSPITDKNGKLKEDFASVLTPVTYKNANWGLQLDVPNHLKDEHNKLGVQIATMIFANLSKDAIYKLGDTVFNGKDLQEKFFDVLVANIEEDSKELLERIGAKLNKDGRYEITNVENIHQILFDELEARGLADTYKESIKLIQAEDGTTTFNIPLFANSMADKYQSILTSLFANSVTNQKSPGGHVVLASGAFITDISSDTDITGIEYHAEVLERVKAGNFKLNFTHYKEGNYIVAEAILPAWSKKFFDGKGDRISINDVPEEIRTMLGYRIPTESKYSTVVFKVVGFLPEGMGSTVIMPEELVTQTGWDFDVDSLYIMQKEFNKTEDGKFTVPKFNDAKTAAQNNRAARDNRIFDIFHSILTNPFHYRDIVNPGKFTDPKNLKDKQEKLLGINGNNINPNTRSGQDFFRAANIAGRSLKGMAANANGIFPVLQNINAELRADLAFEFRYELGDVYTRESLEEKYGSHVKFEHNVAIVTHRMMGQTPTGKYVNVDGQVITDHAAQMLAMILDIVKEGLPYNINTYTFDTYMAMLGTGVNIDHAGQYIRQPVLNVLANKVLNNQSILGSSSGKEIEEVKREYQTKLFKLLVNSGKVSQDIAVEKGLATVNGGKLAWKRGSIYVKREETEGALGYNPDSNKAWTIKELDSMIANSNIVGANAYTKEQGFQTWKEMSDAAKIEFFKEQLLVLERFITYKKSGEALADINKVLNTDRKGPGPSFTSLDVWNANLDNTTDYVFDTERKMNNGKQVDVALGARMVIREGYKTVAVTEKVFNKTFKGESVYRPYKAYLIHSNERAREALGGLFIEQSQGYQLAKGILYDMLAKRPSEKMDKNFDKYLKTLFMAQVPYFAQVDKAKVLGTDTEVNTNPEMSIEEFKALGTANQVFVVKQKYPELYSMDSSHLLNFLKPKIDSSSIERNGMQLINFNKPKASDGIDNYLSKSFELMLNSSDEFISTLARSLVSYEYASTGLNYGKNSISTFIPPSYLTSVEGPNLGVAMRALARESSTNSQIVWEKLPNFISLFYQNNWNNIDIVPRAQSRYTRDAEGFNTDETVDGTPDWSYLASNTGVVIVAKKDLLKEARAIQKADYILVTKREGEEFINILLKRHIFEDGKMNDLKDSEAHANYYYYPVNKLGGTALGMEFTNSSVVEANNTMYSESTYDALIGSYINGSRTNLLVSQEIANQIAQDLNQRKCD